MRGLIPHPASYVCEKRYGDCKDMANLIVSMLHMAGVNNAYHTWIGTRDLPFKYTEFPTPIVDNHMIATYVTQKWRLHFPGWNRQLHKDGIAIIDDTRQRSVHQPRPR